MEQQWGPGARVVPSLITTKAGCRAREALLSVGESRGHGGAGSAAWRSKVLPGPRTGSQPSTSIRGYELHGAPHKTRQGQRGQGAAVAQSRAPEVKESDRHRAAAGRRHPPTAPTHTAPPNRKQLAQKAGAQSKPAFSEAPHQLRLVAVLGAQLSRSVRRGAAMPIMRGQRAITGDPATTTRVARACSAPRSSGGLPGPPATPEAPALAASRQRLWRWLCGRR